MDMNFYIVPNLVLFQLAVRDAHTAQNRLTDGLDGTDIAK